jgi:hypothetical protein
VTAKSGWIGCAALCGWLLAGQAFADCTPPAVSGDSGFSICKNWPAYPGQTINAQAKFERAAITSKTIRMVSMILNCRFCRMEIQVRLPLIVKPLRLKRAA